MSNYIEKSSIKYGEVDFEGSRIRTVEEDGELHFCLSDCLKAVGTGTHTNGIKWDNERDTIKTYPLQTAGGKQLVKFVTEAGLYELLEKVNLDQTDPEKSERVLRFRHKLNNEILPSIRKHGAYMTPAVAESVLNNPENALILAKALIEEHEKNMLLESKLVDAIRSRGQISSSREASVMGKLGALQSKALGLEREVEILKPYKDYEERRRKNISEGVLRHYGKIPPKEDKQQVLF